MKGLKNNRDRVDWALKLVNSTHDWPKYLACLAMATMIPFQSRLLCATTFMTTMVKQLFIIKGLERKSAYTSMTTNLIMMRILLVANLNRLQYRRIILNCLVREGKNSFQASKSLGLRKFLCNLTCLVMLILAAPSRQKRASL